MVEAGRSGVELLARVGYAARGAVSLLVGLLALLAAFGRGGATGSKGALQELLLQPLGDVLLAAVTLGLFGFALWRALQSLLDADRLGTGPKAVAVRAGQAVSAVVHLGLGVFAVSLLIGWGYGGGNEERSARDWTRWLLARPLGEWLVGAVGLAILVAGLGMARKAWTASFARRLATGPEQARWVVPLGRAGYAARGVVFVLIGALLLVAAYQSDPSEARGLSGALLALQEQPFGRALSGLIALGLAAFGVFGFVEARFRRINASRGTEIKEPAGAGLA